MSEKRGNLYSYDPITDVAIAGGLALPNEDERGDLDTELDVAHPLYDERLLEAEAALGEPFVLGIDAFGVLTPIRCKKFKGVAFVVFGRRRLRAARKVNRQRVATGQPPMRIDVVLEGSGDEARLMGAMIIENTARSDDGFATTMSKLRRVLGRGVDVDDAAVMFNQRPGVLKSWIAFDDHAADAVKAAVLDGRMSVSAGIEIVRAGDEVAQLAAFDALLEQPVPGVIVESAKAKPITARQARDAAKTVTRPGANLGVADKRTQKRLLSALTDRSHPKQTSDKTLAFWEGAENMLMLVLGETDTDVRLVEMLKDVRKAMKAGAK